MGHPRVRFNPGDHVTHPHVGPDAVGIVQAVSTNFVTAGFAQPPYAPLLITGPAHDFAPVAVPDPDPDPDAPRLRAALKAILREADRRPADGSTHRGSTDEGQRLIRIGDLALDALNGRLPSA